jgi:hypothetical protein
MYCKSEAAMPKIRPTKYRSNRLDMKKGQEPQDKSVGTLSAEKARAKGNRYTDVKREDLLRRGLSVIYGSGGHAKTHAGRG